jgi:uncharacterized protein
MTLEQRINEDLKTAMKAGDKAGLRAIRSIKSAILIFNTDGSGQALTPDKEIQMLQKLVKQRQDSLDIFRQQNRADLAVIEEEEMEVIRRYLPEQLSDEELKEAIQKIVADTGASGMKDMGKVMGMANQQLAGKAEGARIAVLVKQLLA